MSLKSLVSFPLSYLQCSVSCGYGIQSRTVSCLGPSSPLPITPILCVHLPKPITIQVCYSAKCSTPCPSTAPTQEPEDWNKTSTLKIVPEEKRFTSAPAGDTEKLSEVLPTVSVLRTTTTLSTQPLQSSYVDYQKCGMIKSVCKLKFLQTSQDAPYPLQ